MSWYVGGEDAYYEPAYMPECPECSTALNEYGECSVCLEDEFYQDYLDAA